MRFQRKVFLGVLLATLLPLAALFIFSQLANRRLADDVADLARDQTEAMVTGRMMQGVEGAARELTGELKLGSLALQLVAGTAETTREALQDTRTLLPGIPSPLPARGFGRVARREAVPLLTREQWCPQWEAAAVRGTQPDALSTASGTPNPSNAGSIAPSRLSYLAAPDVDEATLRAQLPWLATLLPQFNEVGVELGCTIFRARLALDAGVTIYHPAQGGFPAAHDPRLADWFTRAGTDGALRWQDPVRDPSTGQVLLTASRVLYNENGERFGVVALDVHVSRVLRREQRRLPFEELITAMVVEVRPDPQTGQPLVHRLSVNASSLGEADGARMSSAPLDATPRPLRRMADDLTTGTSGSISFPHNGRDAIWAYAPMVQNVGLVLIVPEAVLEQLPRRIDAEVREAAQHEHKALVATMAFILLALVPLVFWWSRRNARQIGRFMQAWERLGEGDFSVRIDARLGDERDEIVRRFNETVPKLAENYRMSAALKVAEEVQHQLLPETWPQVQGLDLAGRSMPCDEAGGDYFDFYQPVDGPAAPLHVIVGDVTGHGVGAAILMATGRALLRMRLTTDDNPASAASAANRLLTHDTFTSGRFMTLFALRLDPTTRHITWVRAGHDPALVYDPARDAFRELAGGGPPLGVLPDVAYAGEEDRLEPGQIVTIGTDGIWERHNGAGQMYGKKRFMEVVRTHAHQPAQAILDAVLADVAAFAPDQPSEDDITLVVVKLPYT